MHPLPLPNDWYSLDSVQFNALEPHIADWIKGESSLTVKIKELGIAFNVEVIAETQLANTNLAFAGLAQHSETALHREVLLKQGDSPLVYAQTIMPSTTISGTEKMLSALGNQSLGQILFQSPQAIRGAIEFSVVTKNSTLGLYIQDKLNQTITETCYIRRSMFQLNGKPLLVCECFLPSLMRCHE